VPAGKPNEPKAINTVRIQKSKKLRAVGHLEVSPGGEFNTGQFQANFFSVQTAAYGDQYMTTLEGFSFLRQSAPSGGTLEVCALLHRGHHGRLNSGPQTFALKEVRL
jgi:hypothetical protein